MGSTRTILVDLVVIVMFMAGFAQFRAPRGARRGNWTAAIALALATVVVLLRDPIHGWLVIVAAVVVGGGLGWTVAARVTMVQIPAMVAFQHGAGGVAAFLVSAVELTREPVIGMSVGKLSGLLGLTLGAATFAGSLIAGAKLMGTLQGTPVLLPRHGFLTVATLVLVAALGAGVGVGGPGVVVGGSIALIVVSMWLGFVVAIRIGGADMPVLISFLNAAAGLAAAFCGILIQSRLLVVCGAVVAASGGILTQIMCRAMNRRLMKVFLGFGSAVSVRSWLPAEPTEASSAAGKEHTAQPAEPIAQASAEKATTPRPIADTAGIADAPGAAGSPEPEPTPPAADPHETAIALVREAKTVIVVPGYGMALAQAQFQVVQLARLFESRGTRVLFAIHPVAGRMPGHMNVLLAEADVSYDQLIEMEEANLRFKGTDLALVVGACDVVNPAAVQTEGTPISGMPILNVHDARHVLVCNLDARPGYSGVENLLYSRPNVVRLFGDAKQTLERIIAGVTA